MKRFLLFAGDEYYPLGGWRDFAKSADSAEELMIEVEKLSVECDGGFFWFQIIDSETGEELDENKNQFIRDSHRE